MSGFAIKLNQPMFSDKNLGTASIEPLLTNLVLRYKYIEANKVQLLAQYSPTNTYQTGATFKILHDGFEVESIAGVCSLSGDELTILTGVTDYNLTIKVRSIGNTAIYDIRTMKINYNTFSLLDSIEGDGAVYMSTLWNGYDVKLQDYDRSSKPEFEVEFELDDTSKGNSFGLSNLYGFMKIIHNADYTDITLFGKGASIPTTTKVLENGVHILRYGSIYSYIDEILLADNLDGANQYRINAFTDNYDVFYNGTSYSSNFKVRRMVGIRNNFIETNWVPVDNGGTITWYDTVNDVFATVLGAGSFIGNPIV